MKAVWSFWTKPYLGARATSWQSDFHHWLAWGLSVYAAQRHYPDTSLVTDDAGARVLVDALRLPFRSVSTALNAIAEQDPEWWALGKIEAYRRQRDPFVHIDADVFLWKALAPDLEVADVVAQHPEPIIRGASYYRPEDVERAIGHPAAGWLPEEWTWYGPVATRAECCGILGGRRVDFINHYAETAFRLVTHPRNRDAFRSVRGKGGQMTLIEQYLLSACIEYHRDRARSPHRGVGIRYVFDTVDEAFAPRRATHAGFTHLAADAKRNTRICRDLERRVRSDLPAHYERCREYAQSRRRDTMSGVMRAPAPAPA